MNYKYNPERPLKFLFLGGAKRVSMGNKFIAAAERLGLRAALFSYEMTREVPIASIAQVEIGLRWSDPLIIDDLRRVVERYEIDILVPFVDGAVEVAARFADRFPDVWVATPDAAMAELMFDKVAADSFFRQLELPVPQRSIYPLIAKPRHGSASKGIKILRSVAEFKQLTDPQNYLYQEYIEDRQEITVDCYVESDGRLICAVPRLRIEVQGGEVTTTRTFRDREVEALAAETLQKTGLTGAITIQMLRDHRDNRLMLMEINPRLGGGAVCSCHAGADLPQFLIRDALGLTLEPCSDWKSDVLITRYPQEVAFFLNPQPSN